MKEYSPVINEDFLQYIWRTQKFDHRGLRSTDGAALEIIRPGTLNFDQGPDFMDARLRISGQLWAGKVEIHTRSSDWYRHGHENNPDYFNVILHVVYEADQTVKDPFGEEIPTLELKSRIDETILETYRYLSSYTYTMIPCEKLISTVSRLNITSWKERMAVARLEEKYAQIEEVFLYSDKNYQETLFKLLCRSFGFSKNNTAFEWLANTIKFKTLSRHINDKTQIESLLFGQAGLLSGNEKDEYPQHLYQEYIFLSEKYGLDHIDPTVWNYARMRPQNFPTVRLSQLADFLYNYGKTLMYSLDWQELVQQLHIQASPYWNDHYRFDVPTTQVRVKKMGQASKDSIFINVLVPFLFFTGMKKRDQSIKDKAVAILENLPAETNSIMRMWKKLDVTIDHALDSQALLYLYHSFCRNRKCAQCRIGQAILLKS
ncbi:MAG TPA: DUF2851 family protein [Membranihabitans sp.]|nr:DUF2851 family protein [Membranihabitans sp.]